MDSSVVFESWSGLGRVAVAAVFAYTALVATLRISGKRTLSKMNAFDLIVTVALGSTLATIILSKDVVVLEGILALGLLVALQYVVTWSSIGSVTVSRLVKADPTLLLYRGQLLHASLRQARVVEAEVRAAVREQGIGALEDVEAVVLETDGPFSVIKGSGDASATALEGIRGTEPTAS